MFRAVFAIIRTQKIYAKAKKRGLKSMQKQLNECGAPHILVPIRLDTPKESIEKIQWLNENFGFTCFCPDGLSKGYRAESYPTQEEYIQEAKNFAAVREWAKKRGLSCGWLCNLTVKSGPGFTPILRADGTPHPFANCPMDKSFSKTLASDISAYCAIARPDFIFVEDDFSLSAAGGCFCERHLAEFAKKQGRRYEREELLSVLKKDTPEAIELNRAWQNLKKDTLIDLARDIRDEMDKECPEIPIGLMQSGAADLDGDFTEDVARALAGERHTPFVRLYGTFYCGFESKKLPSMMHHPLYFTQHMGEDMLCYHESDTYPHTRFYTSGKQANALLGAAYSYGMVGSIYFAQQYFDHPYEEDAFGKVFKEEHARFKAVSEFAAKCLPFGVEVCYDPFYNMLEKGHAAPFFSDSLGRFGIPFSTTEASVAFLDARQARYFDHGTLMRYLAKGLFLDGEAAHILCHRGYGEYLGVSVGNDVLEKHPPLVYDLGALEVITEAFVKKDEGHEMWCAHCYCPYGNGKWMELTVTNEKTEIITEGKDFRGNLIAPAMTYFENTLGGRICVMSLTVRDNPSQALFNYRRQDLFLRIIRKMADEYPLVQGAPDLYAIAMRPKEDGDLLGMLTLINLGEDDAESAFVHLPPYLRAAGSISVIERDGSLAPLPARKEGNGIRLANPLCHLIPTYVIFRK